MCVHIYIYVYIYIFVCIYIYIYIFYVYIYICIMFSLSDSPFSSTMWLFFLSAWRHAAASPSSCHGLAGWLLGPSLAPSPLEQSLRTK